jgi:hypothetical protein
LEFSVFFRYWDFGWCRLALCCLRKTSPSFDDRYCGRWSGWKENGLNGSIEPGHNWHDASTVAVMREALNEIVMDLRFLMRKTVTPLEEAEHILQQAVSGDRDLSRLKSSAFENLSAAA